MQILPGLVWELRDGVVVGDTLTLLLKAVLKLCWSNSSIPAGAMSYLVAWD